MTRDNSKNRKYKKEEKEKLLTKVLPPESISPRNLSIETGISQSALVTWKAKATKSGLKKVKSPNKISSKEKFINGMEIYTLSEFEVSRYCREHCLYGK